MTALDEFLIAVTGGALVLLGFLVGALTAHLYRRDSRMGRNRG